jgi:peptide-methionine (S)-S-oxide reductase
MRRSAPFATARLLTVLLAVACAPAGGESRPAAGPAPGTASGRAVATFAMGCFWCAEDAFERVPGVSAVVSGYTGGNEPNPTYEQVSAHQTHHYEAIKVTYDPSKVSYEQLLDVFWHNVDPLDGGGQFCDRGEQYRAAVFAHDAGQRSAAEASAQRVSRQLGRQVAVPVLAASRFWDAEEYHQDYATRNPLRYKFYSGSCGRAARLEKVWGEAAGGHR